MRLSHRRQENLEVITRVSLQLVGSRKGLKEGMETNSSLFRI